MRKLNSNYFRNLIFGVEDGVVSTVGVLFGLASSHQYNGSQVLLAGFIIVIVEALSMGAGAFLSEESVEEFTKRPGVCSIPLFSGLIMFASYVVGGLLPVMPYAFFRLEVAQIFSIIFALVSLYFLGYLPTRNLKSGLRMFLVAGLAIFAGYAIGSIFS